MNTVFLEGRNVNLRPLEPEDLDGPYADFINDQNGDTCTEHAIYPHSRDTRRAYAEQKWSSRDSIWLAIIAKDHERHIGNVELRDIDLLHGNAWFNILVAPDAQGKGYGAEAAWLILNHGFERLNLYRISLGVREDNEPALKLYERLGFQVEGRQRGFHAAKGKRHDNILMGLLRGELRLV